MTPMPSNTPRRPLHALPPGTVLRDYVIDSELGSSGFRMVYLARHRLNTDWLFAIKGYLQCKPGSDCSGDYNRDR